jgi:RNA polymerase sigma-70 factor, ECF subfamily
LEEVGPYPASLELDQIIHAHAGMVQRIASVYERHPDAIDDLVQDVWIAVWEALPRLKDPADLKPYIARITQNICVSHVRRVVRRQTHELADDLRDAAPLPDLRAGESAKLARLIEAVRKLPENLKCVVSLFLEEMPIKEIAQTLGISESNASVRLHRAKAALLESLRGTL